MTDQREQLILDHLSSIKHIAFRFSAALPPNVDLRDLVSEGVFGLLSAAERFDPARGVKFKTYAEARIRGAILDSLRSLDWLPRSVRRRFKKLSRTCDQLAQQLGRPATEAELAKVLGLTIEQVRELMSLVVTPGERTSELTDGSEPHSRVDHEPILVDHRSNALLGIQRAEMSAILAGAVRTLPVRERLVISLYYYDGLTMKEIGKRLGVKESRISQYHARAKSRLYSRLRKVVSTDPRVWSTLE